VFICDVILFLFVMAVEGRKRTFALSGPYIPAPYTSSDSEKPNEMPRNSVTSGTRTKTTGTFKFFVVFLDTEYELEW